MYKEHPVFKKPDNEECSIWRYMSFAKFIDLMSRRALFFSRADLLGDPFEGSYPRKNIELRSQRYKKLPFGLSALVSATNSGQRKYMGVNCWSINDCECTALWKSYVDGIEGVAIRSTFRRLADSFKNYPQDVFVGKVSYLDYTQESMPESGNLFDPYVHKRTYFSFEKELRAFIWDMPLKRDSEGKLITDIAAEAIIAGKLIPVDLRILIDEVRVPPDTPKWFFDLVGGAVAKAGLVVPVNQSGLDGSPRF